MSIKIASIDLETTGLKQAKGDRIIEIALITANMSSDFTGWNIDGELSLNTLVNPRRPIPEKITEITGLKDDDVADAPYWEDVAPKVVEVLKEVDLLIAHNMDFDGPFLGEELLRVGQAVPNVETFCTMQEGRWATGNGKVPSLGELCWTCGVHYGTDKGSAHRAKYDASRTLHCFIYGIQNRYYEPKLPEGAKL